MNDPSWRIEDPDPNDAATGGPQPALVSLHFLRAVLRRRWWIWVSFACAGLMLGAAWTFVLPAKSAGTVTLLLAHDPGTDPNQAMSTDVSLLRTRTVAASVIDQLGLQVTPEAFQESVTATTVTANVLLLEVSAPDDAAAVAQAKALSDAFVDFRTAQMQTQSDALLDGYRKRVAVLQQRVDGLTKQYDALSSSNPEGQSLAVDVLARRSQADAEISNLQQSIQDASMKAGSLVAASHVLDPATAVPHSATRRLALDMASGLIGGLALGVGLVLLTALTSNRLRRREEVALAIAAPVRFSVGKVRRRRWWSRLTRRGSSPSDGLQVLVHGLESAISPRRGRPVRLALASVDNIQAAELVLGSLGAQLTLRGMSVFLVDLSESGRLEKALTRALAKDHKKLGPSAVPTVIRPEGVLSLAQGPIGATAGRTVTLPAGDPQRAAWDAADVILTLAEVDPAVGADNLTSWADQVVLLVTAGRSSAERLRTTAELVRSAGLQLLFAMMVRADKTDESLGLPDLPDMPDAGRSEARTASS